MRVLYASLDMVPSPKGASTHITRFVEALAAGHPETTLLTLGARASLPESRYYGARHVRICPPSGDYLQQVQHFREAVAEHLRVERYEVAHFRCIWSGLPIVYAAERCGLKTVYEVNALPSTELPYHYPRLSVRPSLLRRFAEQEQECLRRADAIVTPSAVTQRHILKHSGGNEAATVIPNGVDTHLFTPRPLSPAEGRPLRLLYVGTLAPWQGLETVLQALKMAVRQVPLELLVLGPERKAWAKPLARLVRKLHIEQHVAFLPACHHAQVPEVIHRADICVAPLTATPRNVRQGCNPVKIFEYMACSQPIIAANLPVVREILTHEETALLYRPDDARRLRNAIVRLASDPQLRRDLARRALGTVTTQFTWRHAQERLLEVYTGLEDGCPSADPGGCQAGPSRASS